MTYELDPRLEADSVEVARWSLSDVRLVNDSRYPWLILVPRLEALTEFIDLSPNDQVEISREISRASHALKSLFEPDKLNIGMLGNIVPQLHVHVIARNADDLAWPGPVWGVGQAVPHGVFQLAVIRDRVSKFFKADSQPSE